MKKTVAILLCCMLCLSLLSGCNSSGPVVSHTSQDYVDAITGARTDDDNTYRPLVTPENVNDNPALLNFLGVPAEDMEEYAFSVSLMMVHAYGVAVIKPVEGKETSVSDTLKAFVEALEKSMEGYLADQYAIAKAAIVKKLPSGEVMLVMCADSSTVAASIEKALAA